MKIISGGQTGVDRAALDAAIKHGIECSGWCPAGRLDESGRIPDRYPLKELEQGSFADRTLRNVKDSDATVIIYFEKLRGGTAQTVQFCLEQKRPHLVIDAATISAQDAIKSMVALVREKNIKTLNVAGPRQSEWPGGYEYAFNVMDVFLSAIAT